MVQTHAIMMKCLPKNELIQHQSSFLHLLELFFIIIGECPDQGRPDWGPHTYCTIFDFPFFAILTVPVVNEKQGYYGNHLWFARKSWV